MRKFPWLTAVVFVVTGGISVWAAMDARVMRALERDPAGLSAVLSIGHWWRLVSPLLVQSDGWVQLAFNMVTLAGFGVVAERSFGRWRWVLLYLGGGLVGQVLGYQWEPPGGGNSVAVCGLVGGIVAAAVLAPAAVDRAIPRVGSDSRLDSDSRLGSDSRAGSESGRPAVAAIASLFAAYYVAALTGDEFGGWIAQLGGILACFVIFRALLSAGRPVLAVRLLAGVMALGAVALVVARNHHGASLLFGAGAWAALEVRRLRSRRAVAVDHPGQ